MQRRKSKKEALRILPYLPSATSKYLWKYNPPVFFLNGDPKKDPERAGFKPKELGTGWVTKDDVMADLPGSKSMDFLVLL